MAKGQRHHQAQRLAQAKKFYQRVLKVQPRHPDALHYLGVLAHQGGDSGRAVQLIRRSLDVFADNPGALNNLGRVLLEDDIADEAVEAFRESVRINPDAAETHLNLGVAFRRQGDLESAAESYEVALNLDPSLISVYEPLGMLLYRLDRIEAAAAVYARWLEVEPGNQKAEHLYRSCSGDDVPARAADDYVIDLFDNFAESFDENLAKLDYKAPQLIAEIVTKRYSLTRELSIFDAGCGTGLCGPLLRNVSSRLVGVDLSPGMVAKAREREIYDELIVDELVACLDRYEREFDVVVSADTLVYFGDLHPAFRAAAKALKPGGALAFTVEAIADSSEPMKLNPHGRYSHSEAYVRDSLADNELHVDFLREVELRLESERPVEGILVLATRANT